MTMSTSLSDLKFNNNNVLDEFDKILESEEEYDNSNSNSNSDNIDNIIKDVEKTLDEKKTYKNDYLPLKKESEEISEEKISLKNDNNNNNNNNNNNIINNFLLLILFLIVNHPIIDNYINNIIKIDNYYYKFIIKGIIFVLLINIINKYN
jgi:hypothetical protein